MSQLFDQIADSIPEENKRFVDKSFDIVDHIVAVLEQQGKTQKDLAVALGKSESEISRWLTGTHNFTLKSLTKIESVLGVDFIITPQKMEEQLLLIKKQAQAVKKAKTDITVEQLLISDIMEYDHLIQAVEVNVKRVRHSQSDEPSYFSAA